MSDDLKRCAYCGGGMVPPGSEFARSISPRRNRRPVRPTVDHVVPRSWGGPNRSWNTVSAHSRCNGLKNEIEQLAKSRPDRARLALLFIKRAERAQPMAVMRRVVEGLREAAGLPDASDRALAENGGASNG